MLLLDMLGMEVAIDGEGPDSMLWREK
jgi:hypothetical protein